MEKADFLISLEELFELDEATLSGGESIEQIPGWCSLLFVGLIAMVDEQWGVTLNPEAVLNGQTVNGLFTVICEQIANEKKDAA